MNTRLTYYQWTNKYAYILTFSLVLLFVIITILYESKTVKSIWLLSSVIITFSSLISITVLQKKWANLSIKAFERKIFWSSFLLHSFIMICLVIIAYYEENWPHLEYVGANDAVLYDKQARIISELIRNGSYSELMPTLISFFIEPDNWGVQLIVGLLYSIVGDNIIYAKLFYCLVASGSVLLVFKISHLIWGDKIARLSSILWMLFPYAWFWRVVIRKEELVVFLILLVAFLVIRAVIKNEIKPHHILLIVLSIVAIFLMRTVAGAICILSIGATFLFNKYRGSYIPAILAGFVVLFVSVVIIFTYLDHEFYIQRITDPGKVAESRVRNALTENNLANILGLPSFVVLSWISPFTTIVEISTERHETSHNHRHYLISGLYIWNSISILGLLGMWYVFFNNRKEAVFIWATVIMYVIALGITAMFTSVRHSYIVMPFQFMLIGVGYSYLKNKKWLYASIILSWFLVFAWNYFRIAGRGI